MNGEVNIIAVVAAGLLSVLVSSTWYLPKVFGTQWAKLAKVNLNRKVSSQEMIRLMSTTLLASLVTAYVLAHVAFLSHRFSGSTFLLDSLAAAFWLWLGFTAARLYVHDAFEGRPWKLTAMNAAHELVTLLFMALIIGIAGL